MKSLLLGKCNVFVVQSSFEFNMFTIISTDQISFLQQDENFNM